MKNEKNSNKIGQVLRQARLEQGLSMDEVAERLGIAKATYNRYETGMIGIKAERLVEVAEVMGLSIVDLFEGRLDSSNNSANIQRLHSIIKLAHTVIDELQVKPSPEKIADVVAQFYQEEIETITPNDLHSQETLLRNRAKTIFKP